MVGVRRNYPWASMKNMKNMKNYPRWLRGLRNCMALLLSLKWAGAMAILCLFMQSAWSGLGLLKEYNSNIHNGNKWFYSRDAACRDEYEYWRSQSERYNPGLLSWIYVGPQNTGPWHGTWVGECVWVTVNPWSGENSHKTSLNSRIRSDCPENSTLIDGKCNCNNDYQEDLATNQCRPLRPMCGADGQSGGKPIIPLYGEEFLVGRSQI